MRKMEIDRRAMLTLLGSSVFLGTRSARGTQNDLPVYLSSALNGAEHQAVLMTQDGRIRWTVSLPGRGHGGAFRPASDECIMFARRPGTFALVLNRGSGRVKYTLSPPQRRHFYGHGFYSADGRRLYTTENDFDGEHGVIGIWDASNGYLRVGEYDSFGIGPHELVLLPGGDTLAVANGGIATHPETGRHKLNVPQMAPCLVLIDARDGRLLSKFAPPEELHKLSLRHLCVNARGILFAAAQYEGAQQDTPPLLVSLNSNGLDFHEAPQPIQRAMRNYCGSVTFDRSGDLLAVSCPRGNLITYWNAEGKFVSSVSLRDGCGLAHHQKEGAFMVTSGEGQILKSTPQTARQVRPGHPSTLKWDNHIAGQS